MHSQHIRKDVCVISRQQQKQFMFLHSVMMRSSFQLRTRALVSMHVGINPLRSTEFGMENMSLH